VSEPIPNSDALTAVDEAEVPDTGLRLRGRRFLLALYKAKRSIKLYPIENAQVTGTLEELTSATSEILTADGSLKVRISSGLLYINEVALRLEADNFASFGHVISALSRAGIGELEIDTSPGQQEWKTLVVQLLSFEAEEEKENRVYKFQKLILERGVRNVTVGPPSEGEGVEFADELARKRAAKRTYQQSVSVTKGLFDSARMGRAPRLRQVRHAVQGIVDQVLNNEVSMMGLSTLKDYDDYTFTHTVNVCIFSVAIGRRLGLDKAVRLGAGGASPRRRQKSSRHRHRHEGGGAHRRRNREHAGTHMARRVECVPPSRVR